MCEIHRYSTVHSDGTREKFKQQRLCEVGQRMGRACDSTQEFRHPANERRPGPSSSATYYNMPPSPPSSDSSFPMSGNETDSSRTKRRSGVYVNGAQVIDLGRSKSSRREKRSSSNPNGHIVVVDPPVTASSPPRSHPKPILKQASPPAQYYAVRPEVRLEVNNTPTRPSKGHSRQTSYSSRHSSDNGVSDEERRVHKLKRELEKAEEKVRQAKIQSEIERQNEAIKSRPAVPSAPNPLSPKQPSYQRPTVTVRPPQHDMADAMAQLRVSEKTIADADKERRRQLKRAEERRLEKEEEAQRQRLKDRMMPSSQRRQHKVLFSDGTYRYEYY